MFALIGRKMMHITPIYCGSHFDSSRSFIFLPSISLGTIQSTLKGPSVQTRGDLVSLGNLFKLIKVFATAHKLIWLYFLTNCPFTSLSITFFVFNWRKTVVPPPDVSPSHFFHH